MKILYRIYQLIVVFPLFAINTVVTTCVALLGIRFGDANYWGMTPFRWWSKITIRSLLLPVKVEGLENLEPGKSYVYVANHQGFFDIFLVFGYLQRNIRWMMKHEIAKWPFIGISAVRAGEIIVDRRSRAAIRKTYEDARRTLQGGTSVVLFPEGARTYTGHMGFFRRGAFALADELQMPIVPMTINGSFNVMPRNAKTFFLEWHPLRLTIHKPIYPHGQGDGNQEYLKEQSYAAIQSALTPEYQGYEENEDQ